MVWGYIKGNDEKKPVKIKGTLDSQKYISILREHLFPAIADNDIFQKDGAPAHTSPSTIRFFEENDTKLLEKWPAQCPNLNIIEPL